MIGLPERNFVQEGAGVIVDVLRSEEIFEYLILTKHRCGTEKFL